MQKDVHNVRHVGIRNVKGEKMESEDKLLVWVILGIVGIVCVGAIVQLLICGC